MSHLLTEKLADKAIDMILPAITALMKNGTFKRSDLHIVVGYPGIPPGSMDKATWMAKGILWEHSIGDNDKWAAPFQDIARSKAELTWRHGMSTRLLQARKPYLLVPGDTIYFGSATIDEQGDLVVAASGVQPWYDEMISRWMLAALIGCCHNELQRLAADNNHFVPAT